MSEVKLAIRRNSNTEQKGQSKYDVPYVSLAADGQVWIELYAEYEVSSLQNIVDKQNLMHFDPFIQ